MIMTIFRSTLTIDTNDCNNNDNDNDNNNIRSTVCSQDDWQHNKTGSLFMTMMFLRGYSYIL